jgi:5-methylcytosine-specific restriction protein A
VFPGLNADVWEVHHRSPLAQAEKPVATRLQDLAILCPTCHRAIHRLDPLPSVGEFRSIYFGSPQHGHRGRAA